MIRSFRSKEAEKIYQRLISLKLPINIQKIAMRKLWMIDSATNINDLRIPPSNHLEKLIGKRKGQYSIRINKQWRICFNWSHNDAYNIEIIDYH